VDEDGRRKEKSQELDEGVPRAPDMRSRREQIESASPIAFAETSQSSMVQVEFQSEAASRAMPTSWCNSLIYRQLSCPALRGSDPGKTRSLAETLSKRIVRVTDGIVRRGVRILERQTAKACISPNSVIRILHGVGDP
jgi:hypothetical protein